MPPTPPDRQIVLDTIRAAQADRRMVRVDTAPQSLVNAEAALDKARALLATAKAALELAEAEYAAAKTAPPATRTGAVAAAPRSTVGNLMLDMPGRGGSIGIPLARITAIEIGDPIPPTSPPAAAERVGGPYSGWTRTPGTPATPSPQPGPAPRPVARGPARPAAVRLNFGRTPS